MCELLTLASVAAFALVVWLFYVIIKTVMEMPY